MTRASTSPADARRPQSPAPKRRLKADAARFPDFFIVGAPKCGTTALYTYLRSHPDIFMPERKEPHYFCTDFPRYRNVTSFEAYVQLFAQAPETALLGEASVWYLYSDTAIKNITDINPEAKMIIMLRNPTDMVYALHAQKVLSLDEHIKDFREAWNVQRNRSEGHCISKLCREPKHLQYHRVGSYVSQIRHLSECVPQQNYKLVLFDDLVVNPRDVYTDVLKFLGIKDDGRNSFPRVNVNAVPRMAVLRKAFRIRQMTGAFEPTYRYLKRSFNFFGLHPGRLVLRLTQTEKVRVPLSTETWSLIADEFLDEVCELETLLRRDLSSWKSARQ